MTSWIKFKDVTLSEITQEQNIWKKPIEISILKQMQDWYKTDTISVKRPQEKMVPKEKAATASP